MSKQSRSNLGDKHPVHLGFTNYHNLAFVFVFARIRVAHKNLDPGKFFEAIALGTWFNIPFNSYLPFPATFSRVSHCLPFLLNHLLLVFPSSSSFSPSPLLKRSSFCSPSPTLSSDSSLNSYSTYSYLYSSSSSLDFLKSLSVSIVISVQRFLLDLVWGFLSIHHRRTIHRRG